MAELKAEIVKIDRIEVHPNADRMELAFIGGYQVCVQKNSFMANMLAVYIPVDAILNNDLEALIFGPDSKVKLHNHRVRCIKLRGAMSQGMLIPRQLIAHYPGCSGITAPFVKEGTDVTEALGITKYEPPVKSVQVQGACKPKRHHHPFFNQYTDISHLRKYWDAFEEGEDVFITEKIHGTNFRCGWVPYVPRTFWQKVKNIFGLSDSHEFVYGSHRVQLMDGGEKTKDAFNDNIYKRVVDKHELKKKIPKGQVWYGEVFGYGVQKNYSYSFPEGGFNVAFMDIKVGDRYLDFEMVVEIVESKMEQAVPYLWFTYNRKELLSFLNDPERVSFVDCNTKPIEGFVVRPQHEAQFFGGRKILKVLNDEYLLNKDNTDFH